MSYPSDLTDSEWEVIRDFFKCGNYGNRSLHDKRLLVNAVRYITKTGCQWRQLPNDFPAWTTVHTFFWRAKKNGLWEKMLKKLVQISREKMGKNPEPSYAIVDSQSTKTTGPSEHRGIDGGKKNKRSKAPHRDRHPRTSA